MAMAFTKPFTPIPQALTVYPENTPFQFCQFCISFQKRPDTLLKGNFTFSFNRQSKMQFSLGWTPPHEYELQVNCHEENSSQSEQPWYAKDMENIPNIKNNRQELCIQQIEHFDENVLKHKSLNNNNKSPTNMLFPKLSCIQKLD